MARPEPGSFAAYYTTYISKVSEDDLMMAFDGQQGILEEFLPQITEEKANYAYAAGKWTI